MGANCSFHLLEHKSNSLFMKKHFAQKNKKLLCSLTRRREQIALVILLKRAKRAICSFKKSERVIHTKKQRPNYQPCFVSFELIFTCTLALITSLCLCWSKYHMRSSFNYITLSLLIQISFFLSLD